MTSQHLTPYQQRAFDLLREIGPSTCKEVAQRLGWRRSPTIDHLREARKTGLVGRTEMGCYVLWYVAADEALAHAMVEQRNEERRRRIEGKRRKFQGWAEKKARMDRAHESWADAPPVHRRVPASEAPPLELLGPVSVFALASSMQNNCSAA